MVVVVVVRGVIGCLGFPHGRGQGKFGATLLDGLGNGQQDLLSSLQKGGRSWSTLQMTRDDDFDMIVTQIGQVRANGTLCVAGGQDEGRRRLFNQEGNALDQGGDLW